jgi:hypothetical protein
MIFSRHVHKKLVIAIKTLCCSGVSNTPKIPWYLKQSFLHASQAPH